jgi:mRNA interferase MazF
MNKRPPRRGEIWFADFSFVRGHEQGGLRPALIVSTDLLHGGPSKLVGLVPLTTRDRGVPAHIAIAPPEGGLSQPSVIMCDQTRIQSQDRLVRYLGVITPATMTAVETWLRIFFDL